MSDLDESRLTFASKLSGRVTWRLGSVATGISPDARSIRLADESVLDADGLVVATGVRPRRVTKGEVPTHVVRTLADATSLRAELRPGRRVLVLGAGFLGCEIATAAAALGAAVQVVEPADVPLGPHLGAELGRALQVRHEGRGVSFHLGRIVARLYRAGQGVEVTLDDGTVLGVDVVVEAVGCVPDVAWLEGAGFDLTDGLLCDTRLRAVGADPSAAVVAAGDVARFPLPDFDARPRRIEHWNLAFDTARLAGHTLLELMGEVPSAPPPAAPLPSFWSQQAGVRIDCYGIPALGIDDCRLLEGDIDDTCALGYHDASGRLVAAALVDLRRRGPHYRSLVAQSVAHIPVSSG